MSKRKTAKEFEIQFKSVWGDTAELLTPYVRGVDKVLVRFKECGHECWKIPNKLLAGHGCDHKTCRYRKLANTKRRSTEEFEADLRARGYNYTLFSEYEDLESPIIVGYSTCNHICVSDGRRLISGRGCPICRGFKDTQRFKQIIHNKYPGEYEILGEYVNSDTPIMVRHKCGWEFNVSPDYLLKAPACPSCNKSCGEKAVEKFLIAHKIPYVCQFKFENCRDKYPLPFDFAVFQGFKIKLIEFDGSQHFGKSRNWGGHKESKTIVHDKIKNDFCAINGIPLLRIPYWKIKTFETELSEFLGLET